MNRLWMPSNPLDSLPILKDTVSKRESSYDKTGENRDYWVLEKGETATAMDVEDRGCIKHIWLMAICGGKYLLGRILLEMYWDEERASSVCVPLGDFFGAGHGYCRHYASLPMNMVFAKDHRGPRGTVCAAMNRYFPVPLGKKAVIKIRNESDACMESLFFMIDYGMYQEELPNYCDRFHAQFQHENPCRKVGYPKSVEKSSVGDLPGFNPDRKENYVILNAKEKDHYADCVLDIDNVDAMNQKCTWPGEGDDMIFIDGGAWPSSLHGTGVEDCFGAAWGYPSDEYAGPYHGTTLLSDRHEYYDKNAVYGWHIEDPVHFQKSILVTIGHGHANNQGNEYSDAGYWYQQEPYAQFPPMKSVRERCAWSIPLNI